MKKNSIKVNISTRLLTYFLVVSILPIFVLAITSTILIDSSLNEKLTRDLEIKGNSFLNKYVETFSFLTQFQSKEILLDKKIKNKFDFIVIMDKKHNCLYNYVPQQQKISKNLKLFTSPPQSNLTDFEEKSKNNVFFTTIFNASDLKKLNLSKNHLIKNRNGLLTNYSVKKFTFKNKPCFMILGSFLEMTTINETLKNDNNIWLIKTNEKVLFSNILINNIDHTLSEDFKIFNININDTVYSSISIPLKNYREKATVKVILTEPSFSFDDIKQKSRLLILKIALLMTLGGISLAYLLAKSITAPITKISKSVFDLEKGNYSSRVNIKSNDEIGSLAGSFNGMAEALEERTQKILAFNELLINQNNKIEAILNSSADGILTIDSNGKINSANSKITEWTGVDEIDIRDNTFYEVINYDDFKNYPSEFTLKIKDFKEFSNYFPNASVQNSLSGEIINLDITYSEIKSENEQNEKNYVLILRDITKKKEIERIKEDFVATLTHDLRVPLLANVQTFEHLMKGCYGDPTEKQNFIFEQLTSSNKDLLKMVNIILDSYKYEAGKYSLLKRVFNLKKLINETINEISPLIKEKNHELIFENSIEELCISADKHEIKRVLLNLLSNAINYTPHSGKIEISMQKDKNTVIVSIKDTGIGISQNSLGNLFDRYSKGGKTLRKVGTGLGLYLSKQIIDAHNGKIRAESTKDEGSSFYFSLPLEEKEQE